MAVPLREYLEEIRADLRLDPGAEQEVLRELSTHLEEKAEELRQAGLSEEEASRQAAEFFGSPKAIARQMYQVYSQGSWGQALLAALPHLIFAGMFALHIWQSPIWLLLVIVAALGLAIYGWGHGKPAWLFPWLGYLLLPVVIVGLLLMALPPNWNYLALLAYIPITLWVLFPIAIQTVKRDWLFGSLMLLPLPVFIGWFLALQQGKFLEFHLPYLYELAPWIALSFVFLGVSAATFIRFRQRWLKTGALLTPELVILILIVSSPSQGLSFAGLLALIVFSLALLLSPALLQRKLARKESKVRSFS
ncbi:MAG TPA: hypothetical protein G4O03_01520 [Dehalococcoidia bacterium]|jgi:hypothetical protein|nr:hypothetical protein [Dehalococcoidia bacterium]